MMMRHEVGVMQQIGRAEGNRSRVRASKSDPEVGVLMDSIPGGSKPTFVFLPAHEKQRGSLVLARLAQRVAADALLLLSVALLMGLAWAF